MGVGLEQPIRPPARRPGCFIYFKSNRDGLKHSPGKDVQAKQIAALQSAALVHGRQSVTIYSLQARALP